MLALVGVAVSPHQQAAVAVPNALDNRLEGLKVETPGDPDRHATNMDPCLLAAGNLGPHQIPGSEPVDGLLAHQVASGKPKSGQPGALITPAPRGLDDQCGQTPSRESCHCTHAQGVQRMGLGDLEPGSVPLGPAPAGGGHGEPRTFEGVEQGPAGGVDGSSILQGGLGLGQDAF